MDHKMLSYQELRKIVWFIADTVRDKGRGEFQDYMLITVSIMFLKRFMDMRADFKRQFLIPGNIQNLTFIFNGSNIDAAIKNYQSKESHLEVMADKLWTYRLEWHDISSYVKNDSVIDYCDGLGKSQFDGSFENKAILFKEAMDGFKYPTLRYMFERIDFIPKVYSSESKQQVLDFSDLELIISELDKYNIDLKNVREDIFDNVFVDLTRRFDNEGDKKDELYSQWS